MLKEKKYKLLKYLKILFFWLIIRDVFSLNKNKERVIFWLYLIKSYNKSMAEHLEIDWHEAHMEAESDVAGLCHLVCACVLGTLWDSCNHSWEQSEGSHSSSWSDWRSSNSGQSSIWTVNSESFDVFKYIPFLKKHLVANTWSVSILSILKNLKLSQIRGIGNKGMVIKGANGVAHKIWINKRWEQSLSQEFENHDLFNKWIYLGKHLKIIPENIFIPDLHSSPLEYDWVFSMEDLADAQTLKSIELKQVYSDEIQSWLAWNFKSVEELNAFLNTLSDIQLEFILQERCWIKKEAIDLMTWSAQQRLAELFPALYPGFKATLDYLQSIWLIHDDLHNANVMISSDWTQLYIIDFWNVKIDRSKLDLALANFYNKV